MTPAERIAYYRGARHLYEAFAHRLALPPVWNILDERVRNAVTFSLLEGAVFIQELTDWADSAADDVPPPHARIRRLPEPSPGSRPDQDFEL